MKKLFAIVLALALTCAVAFAAEGTITVMSREDGSGTRGAFIELTGVEQDDVDMTTVDAVITNSTAVMLTSVAGDPAAIGYVSMGSLNETVKAVSVDGNAATVEGIKDGSYTLARPFVVTTYGEVGEIAQDLLNYIMSAEGQAIINEAGYIAIDEKEHETLAAAARFGALLARLAAKTPGLPLRILGPAPMAVAMVNGRYRYKLTIKCRAGKQTRALLAAALDAYTNEGLAGKASLALDFHSDADL